MDAYRAMNEWILRSWKDCSIATLFKLLLIPRIIAQLSFDVPVASNRAGFYDSALDDTSHPPAPPGVPDYNQ